MSVRVRGIAIAERDGARPPSNAGVRLLALHCIALRLADTDALRTAALADLRVDERDAYFDEAGDDIDGFDSEEACADVRRAEARGRAGEVACAAAIDAWTETLDAVEGEVPDTCFAQ